MENFELIHVGKCGGSTIRTLLNNNNVAYSLTHVEKVIFKPDMKYVIVIRNPIKRFISAFNWRYKLVITEKIRIPNHGEEELLEEYKNVINLIRDIKKFEGKKITIGHINKDISFYLDDFLKFCSNENILGVITMERLHEDYLKIFGPSVIDENIHINNNGNGSGIELSDVEYENLKEHLKDDYDCIDRLYEIGCLSEEQYEILSK